MARQTTPSPFDLLVEFEDRVDGQRAKALTNIGLGMTSIGVTWLFFLLVAWLINTNQPLPQPLTAPMTYIGPVLSLAIYQTARRGQLSVASGLFITQTILLAITLVGATGLHLSNVILFTMPIAAAGGLLRRGGVVLTTVIMIVIVIIYAIGQRQNPEVLTFSPSDTVVGDLVIVVLTLVIDTALLYVFAGWAPLVAADSQRDVIALQRVAAFGASLDIDDENRLMAQGLSFARVELKFSFAQVFLSGVNGLLDERVRLIPGGTDRVERAPLTSLPEASAIREAATVRRSLRVTRADSYLRRTHFLPTSVCGALLPLVYNDTLLGVLDVQHEAIEFIPDYQMLTLQTLADNLAATIATVRQSVALKTTVRQQEETAQALRVRLQELTLGARRTAQRTGRRIAGYDLANDGQLIPSTDLPSALRAALDSSELQVVSDGEQRIIRLPISLRDEQLGVMSFTLPADRPLTERQIETAKIIANRLALALENRRLADQTRAQIERERIASEVATDLTRANDVDSVLLVAVEKFREALGAVNSRITVQPFTPPPSEAPVSQASPAPAAAPQPLEDNAR
ncbi:MAG: hypothetical protein MUC99_03840 [Anaerolineae bacterium]|jgi:hypothetical protein|nr:hypothetical protein [Anaerolineae bacterium]